MKNDIIYQSCTSIKSHVLADFVVNFSSILTPEAEKEVRITIGPSLGTWTLIMDGSAK